ncbi:MAG TPA: energy transducer TonB [Chthoniobacterales bacterium]|nr:energy transducer TonB [Chthoniobacterales bacterium]
METKRSIWAALIAAVFLISGCATQPPHYVIDKEKANARRKSVIVPTTQTDAWKTHDKLVALFPHARNLPRYKDLAGHTLQSPKVIDTGQPIFPQDLVNAHQQGRVFILVLVSETGDVIDVRILLSSNASLNAPALASTRRWKFSPATVDGKACKFIVGLPYDFRVTKPVF